MRKERSSWEKKFKVEIEADSRIEPIPCGERQWGEDVSSAILEVARREGETISLSEEE